MVASDINVALKMNLGNPILDVAGREILDVAGRNILDMGLAEVRTRTGAGIKLEQGISGSGPDALVADPGTIEAVLDNVDGWYTPDDAVNKLPAFEEGLGVVLELSQGAKVSRTRGSLRFISPDASNYRRRGTQITAYDWMLEAEKTHPNVIPVQLWQRDDQLIETLLANMPNPPLASSLDLGADEYPYSMHTFQDENAYAIGVLQAIALSGLGRIYVRSDTSYGETLIYENRHQRYENTTPVATISDEMQDVEVKRDPLNRARKITVHFAPVRIDTLATSLLYQLPREIVLEPGQSKALNMRFTDPLLANTRVSGLDVTAAYEFSSTTGAGDDLHDDLVVNDGAGFTIGGNGASGVVHNDGAVTGYLHTVDLTGRGIYLYNPDSRFAINDDLKVGREIDFVMPFLASGDQAQAVADRLLAQWGSAISEVESVTFNAARNAALADAMLDGDIGRRVTLEEAKTALSADFYIQHRTIGPITHPNDVPVLWTVTPAFDSFQGWILQSAGRSELPDAAGENGTTRLWL